MCISKKPEPKRTVLGFQIGKFRKASFGSELMRTGLDSKIRRSTKHLSGRSFQKKRLSNRNLCERD